MKTVNIKPVKVSILNATPAVSLGAEIIKDDLQSQCVISFKLLDDKGNCVLGNTAVIEGEEYENWTGDNGFPFDFLLQKLNLEIDNSPRYLAPSAFMLNGTPGNSATVSVRAFPAEAVQTTTAESSDETVASVQYVPAAGNYNVSFLKAGKCSIVFQSTEKEEVKASVIVEVAAGI